MKCPNCQTANREGARFCKSCGEPLGPLEQPPPPQDTPAPEPPPAPPNDVGSDRGATQDSEVTLEAKIEAASPLEADAGDDETVARQPPDTEQTAEDATPADGTSSSTPDASALSDDSQSLTTPSEPPPDTAASTPEEHATETQVPEPTSQEPLTEPATTPAKDAESDPVPAKPDQDTAPLPEEYLPPLQPGALIAGRYEIVESLEHGVETNLYSARDLTVCPVCGFEHNQPDEDGFCAECGAELRGDDSPVMCELQEALSPDVIGVDADAGVFHDNRFYVVVPDEEMKSVPDEEPAFPHGITFSVGYASDVGMVRDLDEDSLCVFTLSGVYESVAEPTLGLFIVADGMGGHEGGEVASKLTVQMVAGRLIPSVLLPRFTEADFPLGEAVRTHIKEAISAANERIFQLAQERANEMGCTLTMALMIDDKAYIANVGDSRTYIRDQDGLHQITTDHSVVASLIAAGMAEPEELYTHDDRHVVYRAIGTKPEVEVDIWEEELGPGDTLLLCCDGLWEAIRDEGIEEVLLTQFDPQAACEEMVHRANQAGGEDNISVILTRVQTVNPPDKPEIPSQD